jgi:hypothetical protein
VSFVSKINKEEMDQLGVGVIGLHEAGHFWLHWIVLRMRAVAM